MAYNELMVMKGQIVNLLNLGDDEFIEKCHIRTQAGEHVVRFFN